VAYRVLVLLFLAATPLAAQPLTIDAAIARALDANPDLAAAAAAEGEARHGLSAARAGWFPRLDLEEGWQRGDQPVFVFGSLLAQRRFTEANFAIEALNHPDPVSNHRAALTISQPIFDAGRTAAATRAATAGVTLARAGSGQARADIALAVTQAYAAALVADAGVRAADSAVAAAQEDASRAAARRDAGLATDADVLAIDVHLAQMRARRIAAASDADVSRATLNRLMHAPIDAPVQLAAPPPLPDVTPDPASLAVAAQTSRWDVQQAAARLDLARARAGAARAPFLPSVGLQGGYEWNGGTWGDRASSWVIGVRGQLSLSLAGTELASLRAARAAVTRAQAQRESAEAAARLDVRTATARLAAARARVEVASAAVAQARESARIIRDRFGSGMAAVTDVLRAANALLDAEALDIDTRAGVIVAAAALDRAVGRIPRSKD
jgi:outer membrane protein TolC